MRRFEFTARAVKRPLHWLSALALAGLASGCVVAPYPYGYVEPAPMVSTFDRAWEAAQGAAADAGVKVSQVDRASGTIRGVRGGAVVTINVNTLADGRVQVAFDAPASRDTNPTLNELWLSYYNRRMGR